MLRFDPNNFKRLGKDTSPDRWNEMILIRCARRGLEVVQIVDKGGPMSSMTGELVGVFVYRLGRGPLKAERWVRFPYALPMFDNSTSAVVAWC
jgi:hypothetical protein